MGLSRNELEAELAKRRAPDPTESELKHAIVGYLKSGHVGSSFIGRAYSVSDEGDQEAFANWMSAFFANVYAFMQFNEDLAEGLDDEEVEDDGTSD